MGEEVKIMAEHIPGVDMLAQADISELKTMVRESQKELKAYEKKTEEQEKEILRLKGIAGKSYGTGAMWFTAIAAFVIGVGLTTAFFLLA